MQTGQESSVRCWCQSHLRLNHRHCCPTGSRLTRPPCQLLVLHSSPCNVTLIQHCTSPVYSTQTVQPTLLPLETPISLPSHNAHYLQWNISCNLAPQTDTRKNCQPVSDIPFPAQPQSTEVEISRRHPANVPLSCNQRNRCLWFGPKATTLQVQDEVFHK